MATKYNTLIKNAAKLIDKAEKEAYATLLVKYKAIVKGIVSELNSSFNGKPFTQFDREMDNSDSNQFYPIEMELDWADWDRIPEDDDPDNTSQSWIIKKISWDGKLRKNDIQLRFDLTVTTAAKGSFKIGGWITPIIDPNEI